MRSPEMIREEVLGLPLLERARLARQLLESLDDAPADPDAEQAWAEEIDRRVEALERGEAETENAEVAFQRIEEQRRRKRG